MKNQKGFSLVELLVVVIIIAIIAAIAIPSLLASRRAANEASAVQTLRTIHSAEATYQATTGAGNYGTLTNLGGANLVDDNIGTATPTKSGYDFTEAASPDDVGYCVEGHPSNAGVSGNRNFGINMDGVVMVDAAAAVVCTPATFAISGAALN